MTRADHSIGEVLYLEPGVDAYPVTRASTLDPRNAAAEALAAFLRGLRFVRGGGSAPDTEFNLADVLIEWPEPDKKFRSPSASIVDAGEQAYEEHALTPTALEGSWGEHAADTVLWKTAEAICQFQIDFWEVDWPTREAVSARLPAAFSPYEAKAGVFIAGDPRYFGLPVRATLMGVRRWDTEGSVFGSQRRLTARVQCEVDVVQLRCAPELVVDAQIDVTDSTGD